MATPRCPHCRKPIPPAAAGAARTAWAPFCAERCKLADLQKWLGGSYAIPGRPLDEQELASELASGRGQTDDDR
jgi:uncharacterized protein